MPWTRSIYLRRKWAHSDGRVIRIYEDTREGRWWVDLDPDHKRWWCDSETEARDVWRWLVGDDMEWRDVSWR